MCQVDSELVPMLEALMYTREGGVREAGGDRDSLCVCCVCCVCLVCACDTVRVCMYSMSSRNTNWHQVTTKRLICAIEAQTLFL